MKKIPLLWIMGRIFLVAAILGASLLSPVLANQTANAASVEKILYVDADAAGANDGTSWTDAFTKLQDALTAAGSGTSHGIWQIWVAEGVYYPDEGVGKTDGYNLQFFTPGNNLQIYGGFKGDETSLSERDWQAYPTILSGDINQDDTNTDGNNIDESYHDIGGRNNSDSVVYYYENDGTTRLDGFIITGGYSSNMGGGIYIQYADPQLYNLKIMGNYSEINGGGIGIFTGSGHPASPYLDNIWFEGNGVYDPADGCLGCYGGGLYSNGATFTMTNVGFKNNRAMMGGGAAFTYGGTVTVDGALFEDNSASYQGGAIMLYYSGTTNIKNASFVDNYAEMGGAINLQSGYSDGVFNLSRASFTGNYTTNISSGNVHTGGAINILNFAKVNLANVYFAGNYVQGAWDGGAVYNETNVMNIQNGVFMGNSASRGGGIFSWIGVTDTFSNLTFQGNVGSSVGGALGLCGWGTLSYGTMNNSILWGDTSPDTSSENNKELFLYHSYSESSYCQGIPTFANNNIWQDTNPSWSTGQLNTDPDYVSPSTAAAPTTTGDLHISSTSPMIDAGNTALLTDFTDLDEDGNTSEGTPYDMEGYARSSGSAVDVGAYEVRSNHAPVLDSSGSPALATLDTNSYDNGGTLVTTLLASGAGGDPISDSDSGGLEGIAVIAVDETNGQWQYSLDNGTSWKDMGSWVLSSPSDTQARLLPADANTRVRFVPRRDFTGSATFTFKAWDQTSWYAGTVGDTTSTGGTTAYSTADETASVSVASVMPSISKIANQVTNEDATTGAIAFTVSDADTALTSLTMEASSSNTTLIPNTNIVLGGSEANRTVIITPAANQNGSATITLTVSDGAHSSTTTFDLTVNAVNDAPVLATIGNQTVGNGYELTFTVTATDVDNDTLTYSLDSGAPSGASIDNSSGEFTWTPDTTGTYTITVRISDNGSPALSDSETINVKVDYVAYLPVVIQ